MGGQRHAPAALPPRKDAVPIVQEAGWAPGPIWTVWKISPPPGFDPRAVQFVASRYTDWATPVTGPERGKLYLLLLQNKSREALKQTQSPTEWVRVEGFLPEGKAKGA